MLSGNESIVLGKEKSNSSLFAKICDFIRRNPQRIYWKTSEINKTAQGSPEGMINILEFPTILSIFSSNSQLENRIGGGDGHPWALATITIDISKNNFIYKKVILKKIIGIYWEI